MKSRPIFFLIFIISCSHPKKIQKEDYINHFPKIIDKPSLLPIRENFYIFILAGQSNMAGRGFVQPEDTVSSIQILSIDKTNEWVYAKEPLHYYEPERTGLDCGLSFAKKLSSLYGKKITIGLVPCAVGGSSIEQWLGDSIYRVVTLYSNLLNKIKIAGQYGTLKGLLWHQGESNAGSASKHQNYQQKLQAFFTRVRNDAGVPDLPVYAGQLAMFLSRRTNPFADSVNKELLQLSSTMKNIYVINTFDLSCKSDSIHFDSRSQRIMGERFAKKVFETQH